MYRAFGRYHSTARVVFATFCGDESSPLHCVVPFNRTGCIRNVAGGRLPPLRTHRWVIPFTRTGYIRSVPGTAHRPFPTVSLIGLFFNQRGSKTPVLCLLRTKRDHVPKRKNCQLSIVHCQFGKNCQLSTVNYFTPAASCKPRPARPGWSRGSWGRGSGRRLRF